MVDEPVGTGNTFNNLTINNKTVSEIINNSNNKIVDKIVDSIVMSNTVIYQRNEDNVSEKIDTAFGFSLNAVLLQDVNGTGLMNKTVIAQKCSENGVETVTIITGVDGTINLMVRDIKEVTFEGDDEYNGCSYINPSFKC